MLALFTVCMCKIIKLTYTVYSLLKKKKKGKEKYWSSLGQSNRLALLALFAVEMVASNLNATHPKEEG